MDLGVSLFIEPNIKDIKKAKLLLVVTVLKFILENFVI